MKKAYYREQALERIARDVIIAYDPRLYYGSPAAIPIEDIIEAQGLVLEYQYLRNNGRVWARPSLTTVSQRSMTGKTTAMIFFPSRAAPSSSTALSAKRKHLPGGCALPAPMSWGTGYSIRNSSAGPAKNAALRSGDESDNTLEVQANLLGSILLLPLPQVKRCFYQCAPDGRINSW